MYCTEPFTECSDKIGSHRFLLLGKASEPSRLVIGWP